MLVSHVDLIQFFYIHCAYNLDSVRIASTCGHKLIPTANYMKGSTRNKNIKDDDIAGQE